MDGTKGRYSPVCILKNKSNIKNIYYIILDAMMSLENAKKLDIIVDEMNTKEILREHISTCPPVIIPKIADGKTMAW